MKKILAFSLLFVVAGLLNISCSASASVHKADATRTSSSVQVAYTTAPTK